MTNCRRYISVRRSRHSRRVYGPTGGLNTKIMQRESNFLVHHNKKNTIHTYTYISYKRMYSKYIIYKHKSNLYGCGWSVCVSKRIYDRRIDRGESNLSGFFFKWIGHAVYWAIRTVFGIFSSRALCAS